jgi:hypothetical protein
MLRTDGFGDCDCDCDCDPTSGEEVEAASI